MIMSSRIQLPTETPPQLMPCTRLPARLSRLGRPASFLFAMFIDIGLVPLKESCLDLPIPESKVVVPLIMAEARVSAVSRKLATEGFGPCDDGEDEECLVGVAISMGEVIGIANRSVGVEGWSSVSGVEMDEVRGDASRSWALGDAALFTGWWWWAAFNPIVSKDGISTASIKITGCPMECMKIQERRNTTERRVRSLGKMARKGGCWCAIRSAV